MYSLDDDPKIDCINIAGKEEEARVHQHMHVVAQRQVRQVKWKWRENKKGN